MQANMSYRFFLQDLLRMKKDFYDGILVEIFLIYGILASYAIKNCSSVYEYSLNSLIIITASWSNTFSILILSISSLINIVLFLVD
jgi:hypothetical protein